MTRRAALSLVAAVIVAATPVPVAASAPPPGGDARGEATATAPAEASTSWSVQPAAESDAGRPYFTYEADPGTTLHDELHVANLGTTPVRLAVYASDAFNHDDGTFDVAAASTTAVGVGAWVTTAATTIRVGAGETVAVPFDLTVPAEAEPGDHAGGIVTSLAVRSGNGERGAVVEHRVGVRVHVRVRGALTPGYTIGDVHLARDGNGLTGGNGEVVVGYTVANTGNVRLTAETEVHVSGPFGLGGTDGAGAELNDLLPGETVELTERIAGNLPLGRLHAEVTAQAEVADAAAGDGTDLEPVARSTARWDVAWWEVVLIAAIAVVLGRWLVRRTQARTRAAGPPPAALAPAGEPATDDDPDHTPDDLTDDATEQGGDGTGAASPQPT